MELNQADIGENLKKDVNLAEILQSHLA